MKQKLCLLVFVGVLFTSGSAFAGYATAFNRAEMTTNIGSSTYTQIWTTADISTNCTDYFKMSCRKYTVITAQYSTATGTYGAFYKNGTDGRIPYYWDLGFVYPNGLETDVGFNHSPTTAGRRYYRFTYHRTAYGLNNTNEYYIYYKYTENYAMCMRIIDILAYGPI